MTNIAAWFIGDGYWLGFLGARRRCEFTSSQHFFNAGNQLGQQSGFPETVTAPASYFAGGIVDSGLLAALCLPGDTECNGNHRVELVHVCHIVDKGLRFAGMQKTDSGSISRCKNGCFDKPVETGSRLAQATIGQVGSMPIGGIVSAPFPPNTMLPSQQFVHSFDACTLDSPKLVDGATLRGRFAKTHVVHLADNSQPRVPVKGESCLVKKPVCARATRLARRIQTNAGFAHPNQETADPRGQCGRRMRNARTRFQHETGKTTDWNVRAHTVAINYNKCAVEDIQAPFLDE